MRLIVQVPGKPRPWSPDGYPEVKFFIRILSGPTRRQLAREAVAAIAVRHGVDISTVETTVGQTAMGIAIGKAQAREAVVGWEGVDGHDEQSGKNLEDLEWHPRYLDGIKDEKVTLGLYAEIYRLHREEIEEEKKSLDSGADATGSESSPATTSPSPQPAATPNESEQSH